MAAFQFEKALIVLDAVDGQTMDILLRMGECFVRLGTSQKAIHPFERVLEMDSLNVTALNHLAQLYARNEDFGKALTACKRLIYIDSQNSYYYRLAGTMASHLDDLKAAMSLFRKSLSLNPADMQASLGLCNLLMKMEAYDSVDSIAGRALITDSTFKPMLLISARSAFEQGHYETVVPKINYLLEHSDTTALYARMLGMSYFHLGEYYNVIACMTYLLTHRHDYDWIYYYMGVATRELGDAASSIIWFKLAVDKSISRNTVVYYSQLGQSYELEGDYQGAIKAYRAAYNSSKDGILLYHLARTYDLYYKDKTTALAYYEKYLESDDTIRKAREYARSRMQDMGKF
jgi:tetratricopeptide (TPR) repeat protein